MLKLTVSEINKVFDKAVKDYLKKRDELMNSSEFAKMKLNIRRQNKKSGKSVDKGFAKKLACIMMGIDYESHHYQAGMSAVRNQYPDWVVRAWEEGTLYDPSIQRRWDELN